MDVLALLIIHVAYVSEEFIEPVCSRGMIPLACGPQECVLSTAICNGAQDCSMNRDERFCSNPSKILHKTVLIGAASKLSKWTLL